MSERTEDEHEYFVPLAAAFIRGRLKASAGDDLLDLRRGLDADLPLYRFKRLTAYRLPRVRRVLGLLASLGPTSLLDIGSGRGAFLWPLLDAFPGLPVTALETSNAMLADLAAVRDGGVRSLSPAGMDAHELRFGDRSFDGVTALEVLEHVDRPRKVVEECVRVADRFVVASVPSKPDDNPEHRWLLDTVTLTTWLKRAGARRISASDVRGHHILLAMK